MTRDEALQKLKEAIAHSDPGFNAVFVDRLVALGLLKLDEPKTAEQEGDAWWERRHWSPGGLKDLKAAGFKIVKA